MINYTSYLCCWIGENWATEVAHKNQTQRHGTFQRDHCFTLQKQGIRLHVHIYISELNCFLFDKNKKINLSNIIEKNALVWGN